MLYVDFADIIRDLAADLVSLYFFGYLLIYKRFKNSELFITCTVFNIALMLVVMTIVRTNFNLAVGFGLFALLSVITVRSTPFTRIETAYFFAALALAVINGSGITDFAFVLFSNIVIVGCAWTMSHWSADKTESLLTINSPPRMRVLLDAIDTDALQSQDLMHEKLQQMYSFKIMTYNIIKIDYVKDTIELEIFYNNTEQSNQGLIVSGNLPKQSIDTVYRQS